MKPGRAEQPYTAGRPVSVWTSLHYFNIYRLVVASMFVLAILFWPSAGGFGSQNPPLFLSAGLAYWLLAVFFYVALKRLRLDFDALLIMQVSVDILAITLLMYASGGEKSGMAVMLLVVLASAGLVGQGRLALFFAALATIAVFAEQGMRALTAGANLTNWVQVGFICIGFFATAISARLLARRIIANENLARRRGIDLANQLLVSERVIRDMQDGVLVVDADEKVRQWNPQAEALLGVHAPTKLELAAFSTTLAAQYRAFKANLKARMALLPGSDAQLRARFVHAGESGDVLIYLEDMSRIEQQAQQIKLAALGRLTASIAHEIRNPLSAISHAAEFLREERRPEDDVRLSRIINDNAQRLERLVRDVLELGRRDRADPEPVQLAGFLEGLLNELTTYERIDPALFDLKADTNATLLFDRAHLRQVLWNLLQNARRYCSGGPGAVKMETRVLPALGRVELHVIDDGAGIDEAECGKIFEPFFTTYSKGTGLGLYIARELCEANDALLEWVNNAPGAHFRIIGRSQS